MSANNFILINRKDLTVSECNADACSGVIIGRGKTLNESIDLAREYQKENTVEYGIQFTGRKRGKQIREQSQTRQKQSPLSHRYQ